MENKTTALQCFREIETGFLKLLEEESGACFVGNLQRMISGGDGNGAGPLEEAFGKIVNPLILNAFWGTWIGFILYDDALNIFHILYKYPSALIDGNRYAYMTRFLASQEFSSAHFVEPMTDIIFNKGTRTQPLTVKWPRANAESAPVNGKANELILDFSGLNINKVALEKISKLTENINKNNGFSETAKDILSIAAEFNKCKVCSELIKNNVEELVSRFSIAGVFPYETDILIKNFTNTLIWNRLFDDQWQYLYFIPARFSEGDATSGVVGGFIEALPPEDYFILTQIVNRLYAPFHFSFSMITSRAHARRSAMAAIMARNMSHNIGSHVLSGFVPTKGKEAESKILNQYLQKRMDMIAGVTSGWDAAPEDMWFFGDLINGFLSNTILLDFIVNTYGYSFSEKNILFTIRWQLVGGGLQTVKYKYEEISEYTAEDFCCSGLKDLIGKLAGMGVTQPAPKQGQAEVSASEFLVWLNGLLGNKDLCKLLKIEDESHSREVSALTNGDPAVKLLNRELLSRYASAPVVRVKIVPEGAEDDFMVSVPNGVIGAHAFYVILENAMRNSAKYCENKRSDSDSDFEVYLDCVLEPDKNAYLVKLSDNLSELFSREGKNNAESIHDSIVGEIIKDSGEPITEGLGIAEMGIAAGFLAGGRKDCLFFELPEKFNAGLLLSSEKLIKRPLKILEKRVPSREYFEYEFYLQAPKNLLIVGDISIKPEKGLGIEVTDDFSRLLNPDSNYKIVYIHKQPDGLDLSKWLSDNHWKLPYRVVISKEALPKDYKSSPERRFFVVEPALLSGLSGKADWEKAVVALYEQWISAKWPGGDNKPKPLSQRHVMMSFHEEASFARWVEVLKQKVIKEWECHVHIAMTSENIVQKYFSNKIQNIFLDAYDFNGAIRECLVLGNDCILYDRHSDFKATVNTVNHGGANIILHPIGQMEQAQRLGDTLSTPPADDNSFKMFILSLIESALTSVVIVDERVLESLLERNGKLRKDGRYSVKSFHERLKILVPFTVESATKAGEAIGVQVSEKVKVTDSKLLVSSSVWELGEIKHADIIVFHQGTIDLMAKKKSSAEWFDGCFGLAPFFVVTSGRGKYIRHLPEKYGKNKNELPFIQVSAIKESLIDDISKYHLVRALSSTKGGVL